MSEHGAAANRSLDALAEMIFRRGWVFEIVVLGASYQPEPASRMIAQAYVGRIMTPDGEVERWALTPRLAQAAAADFAVQMYGLPE